MKTIIGVRVTEEVKKELLKIAQKEDRTMSYLVNRILEQNLGLRKKS